MLLSEIRSHQEKIRAIQAAVQQLVRRIDVIKSRLVKIHQLRRSARIQGLEILQRKIEALDRKDFKVSAIALEDTAPSSKQSIGSLPADNNNNNNVGPSFPANVSADPEFARLL